MCHRLFATQFALIFSLRRVRSRKQEENKCVAQLIMSAVREAFGLACKSLAVFGDVALVVLLVSEGNIKFQVIVASKVCKAAHLDFSKQSIIMGTFVYVAVKSLCDYRIYVPRCATERRLKRLEVETADFRKALTAKDVILGLWPSDPGYRDTSGRETIQVVFLSFCLKEVSSK